MIMYHFPYGILSDMECTQLVPDKDPWRVSVNKLRYPQSA